MLGCPGARFHRLPAVFDLVSHGPDTFVGAGPRYPWGGLYGGQIVAQALRAAADTVEPELLVHSLRAYFIRRGDHAEPVRYEVDRIRNGRSFATRRVVARQAIGAILNLEASFQRAEASATLQPVEAPDVDGPEHLEETSWSTQFDRRFVPESASRPGGPHRGRADGGLDEGHRRPRRFDAAAAAPLLAGLPVRRPRRPTPCCAPTRAGRRSRTTTSASRPASTTRSGSTARCAPTEWHLHDVTCHAFGGGRGLTIGHVFAADGTHVATFAQELLLRDPALR